MRPPVSPHLRGRAGLHQAAACFTVRHDDDFLGAEHLSRLGHKPDAAKCNDLAIHLTGFAGQLEAVTYRIGQVLNLRLLVVVRQDDGMALAF